MFRILLLEDDLKTIAALTGAFARLEEKYSSHGLLISLTVLSEYIQVKKFTVKELKEFDTILLDRDCKIGGSFHVLPIEELDVTKIIAISSTPPYNDAAQKRGVTKIVEKNYALPDAFSHNVSLIVESLIKEKMKVDPLYKKAKKLAMENDIISTAMLQRALSLGYTHASELIHLLELDNVVSPADGAKPREVLVKNAEEYLKKKKES